MSEKIKMPVPETTAQQPLGRSEKVVGMLRDKAGSIAGRVILSNEVLEADAQVFRSAGAESLAKKNPEGTTPINVTPDEEQTLDTSTTTGVENDETNENTQTVKDPEVSRAQQKTDGQLYVEKYRKKHMTFKPARGFGNDPEPGMPIEGLREMGTGARTPLQKQAELRANTRLSAINIREQEIAGYVKLYGEIVRNGSIVDPNTNETITLDQVLKSGHYSASQKHAIKKAARKSRRAQGSIDRLTGRLEKAASGNDISGKLVRGRAIVQNPEKLEDKAEEIKDSVVVAGKAVRDELSENYYYPQNSPRDVGKKIGTAGKSSAKAGRKVVARAGKGTAKAVGYGARTVAGGVRTTAKIAGHGARKLSGAAQKSVEVLMRERQNEGELPLVGQDEWPIYGNRDRLESFIRASKNSNTEPENHDTSK